MVVLGVLLKGNVGRLVAPSGRQTDHNRDDPCEQARTTEESVQGRR